MLVWPSKDPAEILDFDIDWSQRLGTDTISASSWAIVTTDGVLILQSNSFTATRTKAWLTAGTDKANYVLQNTVTTVNGDTAIESVVLPVRKKLRPV